MTTLTPAQVYALARGAGLAPMQATVATAIAGAESGYRTDAVGDVGLEDGTWGPSVGLWQIRSVKAQTGTGQTRDASRLTDPKFNAASMASISGGGSNFNPWSTYKNGAYKQHGAEAAKAEGTENSWGAALAQIGGSLPSWLGGEVTGAGDGVEKVAGLTSGWGADALKIGMYVVGGAAAAGLVIVGAVHTVSSK